MKSALWYLFAIIAALNIFDIVSTYKVLDKGGTEQNPIVKGIMAAMGVLPALILFKTIVLTLLAIVAIYYPSDYLAYGMIGLIAFYGWVSYNNYKNLG